MSSNDEVISRLEALTAQVAKLAAAVSSRSVKASADPKRLTVAQVLAQLGVSRTTLRGYAARGLCTEIRPSGKRGGNCRIYYLPDEIDALAISEEAARDLMARKRLQTGRQRATR
ncbi:: HTH_17 [Gemmata massiliana]|uniref:: HTH_17 n=1 Tax=Gemmata massiliana TaxID=1210884 RepID=A0A6P2DIJ9_9BACT|nr:helix-turn-helix domain-containing protein [Gemmata massiliana]VTS01753.1 : HTH_17 [Gemmata massiliana]